MRALADNILVKPYAPKESDIIHVGRDIHDDQQKYDYKTHVLEGEVVAVGPGKHTKKGVLVPLDVEVGDIVAFTNHRNEGMHFGSEKYWVIQEADMLGVLE